MNRHVMYPVLGLLLVVTAPIAVGAEPTAAQTEADSGTGRFVRLIRFENGGRPGAA